MRGANLNTGEVAEHLTNSPGANWDALRTRQALHPILHPKDAMPIV